MKALDAHLHQLIQSSNITRIEVPINLFNRISILYIPGDKGFKFRLQKRRLFSMVWETEREWFIPYRTGVLKIKRK